VETLLRQNQEQSRLDLVTEYLSRLIDKEFTGQIRINLYRGSINKIEKKVSLKIK